MEDEEEGGKKTFRGVPVRSLSSKERAGVVRGAMATEDPDNQLFLQRLKDRMDRCLSICFRLHLWVALG